MVDLVPCIGIQTKSRNFTFLLNIYFSSYMKTIDFRVKIKADPAKVWNALWEDANYREWTRAFTEGSYYKADNLAEGQPIQFLSPEGSGMYSVIDKLEPFKTMAFRHLGEVKNFEEQQPTDETKVWSNAMEVYHLNKTNDGTELVVSLDMVESFMDFMKKTYPVALDKVKEISER